jgi:hypothetical protein
MPDKTDFNPKLIIKENDFLLIKRTTHQEEITMGKTLGASNFIKGKPLDLQAQIDHPIH